MDERWRIGYSSLVESKSRAISPGGRKDQRNTWLAYLQSNQGDIFAAIFSVRKTALFSVYIGSRSIEASTQQQQQQQQSGVFSRRRCDLLLPRRAEQEGRSAMATGGPSSMSAGLLFLNLVLYVVVAVIAGWAINYSIDESFNSRKCADSIQFLCLVARAYGIPLISTSRGKYPMQSLNSVQLCNSYPTPLD